MYKKLFSHNVMSQAIFNNRKQLTELIQDFVLLLLLLFLVFSLFIALYYCIFCHWRI